MPMLTRHTLHTLTLFAATGCGPGSVEEYDAFECIDPGTLCVTLEVPANYTGTPRKLSTGFYTTSDTARIPNETLPTIDYPTIIAGEDYDLSFDEVDFTGNFYLMFILFDEDGGTFIPKADIDYTATTATTIRLTGDALELDTMALQPHD